MSTHNPQNLTAAQYGQEQGYRLLDEDEIKRSFQIPEIEYRNSPGEWVEDATGSAPELTYRTRLSRSALAAARGLTPEASEPETADAFDSWLASEDGQREHFQPCDSLRAAFLAGQRSERKEIADMFVLSAAMQEKDRPDGLANLLSDDLYAIADFLASREPKGAK